MALFWPSIKIYMYFIWRSWLQYNPPHMHKCLYFLVYFSISNTDTFVFQKPCTSIWLVPMSISLPLKATGSQWSILHVIFAFVPLSAPRGMIVQPSRQKGCLLVFVSWFSALRLSMITTRKPHKEYLTSQLICN